MKGRVPLLTASEKEWIEQVLDYCHIPGEAKKRRFRLHFLDGLTIPEVARAERVTRSCVAAGVKHATRYLQSVSLPHRVAGALKDAKFEPYRAQMKALQEEEERKANNIMRLEQEERKLNPKLELRAFQFVGGGFRCSVWLLAARPALACKVFYRIGQTPQYDWKNDEMQQAVNSLIAGKTLPEIINTTLSGYIAKAFKGDSL
jgi:predicted DNA-binding protein YlxM (UPF0122 family)